MVDARLRFQRVISSGLHSTPTTTDRQSTSGVASTFSDGSDGLYRPTPIMDPVSLSAKVPFRIALEHGLSSALAIGARARASTVTAASVKAFPMALRFMIISFGCIKFSPFRKEIIPTACSPSACTGGSGGAEAAKFLYISFEAPGRRATIDARSAEITNLLKAWGSGDEAALGRLAEQVYPELRRMARRYMKNEAEGNTLQA